MVLVWLGKHRVRGQGQLPRAEASWAAPGHLPKEQVGKGYFGQREHSVQRNVVLAHIASNEMLILLIVAAKLQFSLIPRIATYLPNIKKNHRDGSTQFLQLIDVKLDASSIWLWVVHRSSVNSHPWEHCFQHILIELPLQKSLWDLQKWINLYIFFLQEFFSHWKNMTEIKSTIMPSGSKFEA